jgi:hypothetical protein
MATPPKQTPRNVTGLAFKIPYGMGQAIDRKAAAVELSNVGSPALGGCGQQKQTSAKPHNCGNGLSAFVLDCLISSAILPPSSTGPLAESFLHGGGQMSDSLRIIVAEDDDDTREMYRSMFASLGHQVVGLATNGKELVTVCEQQKPALVLSDIKMPDMDGIEAADLLCKRESVPIIFVSGYYD